MFERGVALVNLDAWVHEATKDAAFLQLLRVALGEHLVLEEALRADWRALAGLGLPDAFAGWGCSAGNGLGH
ncbi:MAG TPA: hypothetical protein VLC93_14535 [Myxococcota bacterium]|nr:hypothetical protein [Myxococcota bacterium]